MKYIFEGHALPKVLQENRIRIARGELRVTPLVEAAPIEEAAPIVEDEKTPSVEDNKEVAVTDEKKPVKKSKK